jgi:hypothetical protein
VRKNLEDSANLPDLDVIEAEIVEDLEAAFSGSPHGAAGEQAI